MASLSNIRINLNYEPMIISGDLKEHQDEGVVLFDNDEVYKVTYDKFVEFMKRADRKCRCRDSMIEKKDNITYCKNCGRIV